VTEITAESSGATLRDTTLCKAEMIWVAMITGSMPVSGRAPCAPLPVM